MKGRRHSPEQVVCASCARPTSDTPRAEPTSFRLLDRSSAPASDFMFAARGDSPTPVRLEQPRTAGVDYAGHGSSSEMG